MFSTVYRSSMWFCRLPMESPQETEGQTPDTDPPCLVVIRDCETELPNRLSSENCVDAAAVFRKSTRMGAWVWHELPNVIYSYSPPRWEEKRFRPVEL